MFPEDTSLCPLMDLLLLTLGYHLVFDGIHLQSITDGGRSHFPSDSIPPSQRPFLDAFLCAAPCQAERPVLYGQSSLVPTSLESPFPPPRGRKESDGAFASGHSFSCGLFTLKPPTNGPGV